MTGIPSFQDLTARALQPPILTPNRVRLAYAIAVVTDVLQLTLGPLGWLGADEALDVAAMVLTWRVIGFHPLLLPTWTGCVALVVALRKRQQTIPPAKPGQVIDV
jgi:hypothetical protein